MIYVSSSCIKAKKISKVLEIYGNAGIKNIEFSGGTDFYPGIKEDLIELKEKFGFNYVCHAYFPPEKEDIVINLASCNDEVYEKSINHYENCIRLLSELKIGVLSVHAGMFIEPDPRQLGKELTAEIVYDKEISTIRFCEAYRNINKLCRENGISLYLENHCLNRDNYKRFGKRKLLMLTDFTDYQDLGEKLEFNLLLDLAHLAVSCNTLGLDFMSECAKYVPYTKWLHLSHNDGIFDEHKPLTESGIVYSAYNKYFKNLECPMTLETHGSVEGVLESIKLLEKK